MNKRRVKKTAAKVLGICGGGLRGREQSAFWQRGRAWSDYEFIMTVAVLRDICRALHLSLPLMAKSRKKLGRRSRTNKHTYDEYLCKIRTLPAYTAHIIQELAKAEKAVNELFTPERAIRERGYNYAQGRRDHEAYRRLTLCGTGGSLTNPRRGSTSLAPAHTVAM